MTAAGNLRARLRFQARATVDDGMGNEVAGDWVTQFVVSASMTPKMGGETVAAARLSGQQPWIILVRSSSQTRLVTPGWRIVDDRADHRVFNIRSIADPDGKHAWIEILAQEGAAT